MTARCVCPAGLQKKSVGKCHDMQRTTCPYCSTWSPRSPRRVETPLNRLCWRLSSVTCNWRTRRWTVSYGPTLLQAIEIQMEMWQYITAVIYLPVLSIDLMYGSLQRVDKAKKQMWNADRCVYYVYWFYGFTADMHLLQQMFWQPWWRCFTF